MGANKIQENEIAYKPCMKPILQKMDNKGHWTRLEDVKSLKIFASLQLDLD